MNVPPIPPFEHVRLCPLDDILPEQYRIWQNDPAIRDLTMGFRFPVQMDTVKSWLQTRAQGNGQREAGFSIFFRDTGIGACFLRGIDWINGTGEFGIYVGDQTMQGKGVGYCASVLLLDYAFHGLNLRRLSIEVLADSKGAIRLYQRLGFQHEGVARSQVLIGGQPKDVVHMGLLTKDFSISLPEQAHRLIAP